MLSVVARSGRVRRIVGVAAIVFGTATVLAGGSVLFGPTGLRAAAGHVVTFVLLFNFVAGFFYVACGVAIVRSATWSNLLALAIALASGAVLATLGWYAASGGAFEVRTVVAMSLRVAFWAGVAGWTRLALLPLAGNAT